MSEAKRDDQLRITENVYELLVKAKRERNEALADNQRLRAAASALLDAPGLYEAKAGRLPEVQELRRVLGEGS